MAEALSLAAGVIGVLTAAGQISSLLLQFTKSSKDAPQIACAVLSEVDDIRGVLLHLQSFLLSDESSDQSRTQLLQVDQVVAIMTGCVNTFSELEQLLDRLTVTGWEAKGMNILDRAKWARKEKAISNLMQRLQNHKASLSLILNVLNGNTIVEAKASVDRLHGMIERCYKEMSFRMNKLELRDLRQSNGLPVDAYSYGDASSIMTTEGPSTTSTLPEPASNPSKENILCDFAETLRKSWVYLRNNALDSSRCSVHSKDHCSMTWSCLSGLSWAEVSNISVIELPVMLDEVYNPLRSLQTWSNNHIEPNLHHPDLFGPVLPMKGSHVSSPNGLDLARDGLYSLPCIPNRRHPNTRHRDIKNTSREQLGESFRTPRLKSGGSVGRPMTGMLELERSRARLERTFVGYECAVCKEPLEHIRFRFSCGHVSHDACFYQYLGDFDAQHCPACNLPLLYTILKGKLLDIEKVRSISL